MRQKDDSEGSGCKSDSESDNRNQKDDGNIRKRRNYVQVEQITRASLINMVEV